MISNNPPETSLEQKVSAESEVRSMLQAAGLTEDLPERMLTGPNGQRCEPMPISPVSEQGLDLEQINRMRSYQPSDAWISTLSLNKRQVATAARVALGRRLGTSRHDVSNQILLDEAIKQVEQLKVLLEMRVNARRAAIDDSCAVLERWAEQDSGQRSVSVVALVGRLIKQGFGALVDVADAIEAANRWEEDDMLLDAAMAGQDVVNDFLEYVRALLRGLGKASQHLRIARSAVALEQKALMEPVPSPMYDYEPDQNTLTEAILDGIDVDALLESALLRIDGQQFEDGETLVRQIEQTALEEAERQVGPRGISDLLLLEAQRMVRDTPELAGMDPLDITHTVIAGRLLPPIQHAVLPLVARAKAVVEVYQVTPGARTVVPDLPAANFGRDEAIAFLRVEVDIRPDQLKFVAETEALRQETLKRMELSPLESVVRERRTAAPGVSAPAPVTVDPAPAGPRAPSLNGAHAAGA